MKIATSSLQVLYARGAAFDIQKNGLNVINEAEKGEFSFHRLKAKKFYYLQTY